MRRPAAQPQGQGRRTKARTIDEIIRPEVGAGGQELETVGGFIGHSQSAVVVWPVSAAPLGERDGLFVGDISGSTVFVVTPVVGPVEGPP